MEIYDDDGELVQAEFHADFSDGPPTVVFESCGGNAGAQNTRRNPDYIVGLNLVLQRLGLAGATLLSVDVESRKTLKLAAQERQLTIDEAPFPIPLYDRDDYDQLRAGLGRGAARTARDPSAKPGGGNTQRRVRLYLSFPARAPVSEPWLNALLSQAPEAPSDDDDSEPKPSSTRATRSTGGQGRSRDAERNTAVEHHAMAMARAHFESDAGGAWTVSDVASQKVGYDLLGTRGDERLYIEVKGTSTAGAAVIVTKNEVNHAHHDPARSVLVVVYLIEVERSDGEWTCRGGATRILHEWDPQGRGQLLPLTYQYTLPPWSDDDE